MEQTVETHVIFLSIPIKLFKKYVHNSNASQSSVKSKEPNLLLISSVKHKSCWLIEDNRFTKLKNSAYPKSGTWDPGSGTHHMGGTQDPRPETPKMRPETRDSGPIRCDPRPKTRNPYFTWDPRPEALDTERENLDTYERSDRRPKINISWRKNYDLSELNQMSYK